MIDTTLVGVWNATYVHTMPIMLLAHFFIISDNIVGYFNFPDTQINRYDYIIDIITIKNESLTLNATYVKSSYEGVIDGSKLKGFWNNASGSFPVELVKISNHSEYTVNRPQTPKRPFNYTDEEIKFKNKKANIILSGTFTYPENKKPIAAVVLSPGAGGQDRDETMLDHKPFFVIADYLTNHGIAVLRYDERGIRKSTGDFSAASDVDFAEDTIAGIEYLKTRKETENVKIGIVGHSKGGYTSMIVSDRYKSLDFMALFGSPSVNGEEIYIIQLRSILKSMNVSERRIETNVEVLYDTIQIIKSSLNLTVVKEKVDEYFVKRFMNASEEEKEDLEDAKENTLPRIDDLSSVWTRSIYVFEPIQILARLKTPILSMWGTHDIQVPFCENLVPMKTALKIAGNKNSKLLTLNGVNHLFQNSTTGSISEYGIIEETVSPKVLKAINDWIHLIVQKKLLRILKISNPYLGKLVKNNQLLVCISLK